MMDTSEAAFDNRFTRAFGMPVEKIRTKIRDRLPDPIRDFIAESPFLVMATCDEHGRCDASPKGGKPGFVRILDDGHLLVPDAAGNKLFQSYNNMDANPHVGLIFFIPGIPEVVRVNGRVSIVTKTDLDSQGVEDRMESPLGDRDMLQGIVVEIEEAYTHCPRALTYSNLWDPEIIAWRQTSGGHPLRPKPTG
jgi:PPOX class probable FMN-dependent enzyme